MNLEGSLDAFSLPDIFQLLSFTKKSGGLHLHHADTRGCVWFAGGSISGAVADRGRQALGRRLVGAEAVSEEALAAAVERVANEPGIGVGRALLEAGAIDSELLTAQVVEQTTDAVFDVLRWNDGEFAFEVDDISPDDVGVRLGVEELVAEARARLESWEQACRAVPASDAVLVLPLSIEQDPGISRAEWALLALVDGRRSVAELVALTGRGDYVVVSALAALVERGLLSVRQPDVEEGALALTRRHAVLARLETPTPASVEAPAEPAEQAEATEPATEPAVDALAGRGAPVDVPDDVETNLVDDDRPASEQLAGSTLAALLAAAASAEDRESAEVAPVSNEQSAPEHRVSEHRVSEHTVSEHGASESRHEGVPASPFARAQAPRWPDDVRASADDTVSVDRFVRDSRAAGPGVVPARPEPFTSRRQPDYPEDLRSGFGSVTAVHGSAAVDPAHAEPGIARLHIDRDPSVNKSLLLRLIAGVRGL